MTSDSFTAFPPNAALFPVLKNTELFIDVTQVSKQGQDVIFMENFEIHHSAISCLFGED